MKYSVIFCKIQSQDSIHTQKWVDTFISAARRLKHSDIRNQICEEKLLQIAEIKKHYILLYEFFSVDSSSNVASYIDSSMIFSEEILRLKTLL